VEIRALLTTIVWTLTLLANIDRALTTDHNFEQAGFIRLLTQ